MRSLCRTAANLGHQFHSRARRQAAPGVLDLRGMKPTPLRHQPRSFVPSTPESAAHARRPTNCASGDQARMPAYGPFHVRSVSYQILYQPRSQQKPRRQPHHLPLRPKPMNQPVAPPADRSTRQTANTISAVAPPIPRVDSMKPAPTTVASCQDHRAKAYIKLQ